MPSAIQGFGFAARSARYIKHICGLDIYQRTQTGREIGKSTLKVESQQRGIQEGVVVEMPSKQAMEVSERERNAPSSRAKRTQGVSPHPLIASLENWGANAKRRANGDG